MDDPLEAQQALVEESLGEVFRAYDDASGEGVSHPVVFLLDCEDEIGASIARAWLGDETVDDAIAVELTAAEEAGLGAEERTTAFAAALPFDLASDAAVQLFPYLGEAFQSAHPADGVLVISVTAGGASVLTAPWDARPDA
ncbi:MAG: hypothetical protein AAGJ46_19260 [Planctomycetota bacterium]